MLPPFVKAVSEMVATCSTNGEYVLHMTKTQQSDILHYQLVLHTYATRDPTTLVFLTMLHEFTKHVLQIQQGYGALMTSYNSSTGRCGTIGGFVSGVQIIPVVGGPRISKLCCDR